MPRLINKVTGAVMSVQESIVPRLGREWVPADKPKPEPVKTPVRRARKTATNN